MLLTIRVTWSYSQGMAINMDESIVSFSFEFPSANDDPYNLTRLMSPSNDGLYSSIMSLSMHFAQACSFICDEGSTNCREMILPPAVFALPGE